MKASSPSLPSEKQYKLFSWIARCRKFEKQGLSWVTEPDVKSGAAARRNVLMKIVSFDLNRIRKIAPVGCMTFPWALSVLNATFLASWQIWRRICGRQTRVIVAAASTSTTTHRSLGLVMSSIVITRFPSNSDFQISILISGIRWENSVNSVVMESVVMESVAIVVDRTKEVDTKVSVPKSYSLKEDTKMEMWQKTTSNAVVVWSKIVQVLVVCVWILILEESPFHGLKVCCGARLRSGF